MSASHATKLHRLLGITAMGGERLVVEQHAERVLADVLRASKTNSAENARLEEAVIALTQERDALRAALRAEVGCPVDGPACREHNDGRWCYGCDFCSEAARSCAHRATVRTASRRALGETGVVAPGGSQANLAVQMTDGTPVILLTCSLCDKPATDSLDFAGCWHGDVVLGDEPLCVDCLCGFIEGATREDLAVLIFKKRGLW